MESDIARIYYKGWGMKFDTGLAPKTRQLIGDKLGRLLAETYSLYVQTQNCHWNLTGKEFYEIHILLDKQYHDLIEPIDEIAERIRALGVHVDASFAGFQKISTLKEIRKDMPAAKALEHLLASQEGVIRHCRTTCTFADEHHDHATVDMLGRFMGQIEKYAWMVRSQLNQ